MVNKCVKDLANKEGVELSIAFSSNKANKFKELKGEKTNYYPFIPIKETDNKVIGIINHLKGYK